MRVYLRKWKGPDGEWRTGKTYWLLAYVGGERIHESLGSRDRRAAELIAGDRIRRAELKRAGIRDPFEEQHERPIEEHVLDFEKTLRGRGVVPKYLADRMGCIRAYLEHVSATSLKHLDLPSASGWLTELRKTGLSARSVNRTYSALRQLGIWLVKTRRLQFDPFEELKRQNEAADRRHVRRSLTPEEAERLLDAARSRPLAQAIAERIHAGVTDAERVRLTRLGETRALVYVVALGTGLRRGEIQRLRWQDLDLDRGRVTVTAASAKSRRVQSVDLHEAVVAALAAYRPEKAAPSDRVVPKGRMPSIRVFWADLGAAGIERVDSEGFVVDFHALRTTFISWLAMTGAHPRTAQALARHASITTTMERYTDLKLVDMKGAVGRLPVPRAAAAGPRESGAHSGRVARA